MKYFKSLAGMAVFISVTALLCLSACQGCGGRNTPGNNDTITDSLSEIDKISLEIRQNPRQHGLFFKRAGMYYNQGLLNEAVNDIEIALRLDSLNPIYLITASDYYLMLGKSEQTKQALDKCLAAYPQNTEARFKLAQLYFYVKEYDKAIAEVALIEKAGKQSDKTYYLKALVFSENNMFNAAVESLRKTIEFNPQHSEAYNMLGMMYYEANNKLAVEYFNTAVKLFPQNTMILLNAGLCYEKFGMTDQTRTMYERALQVDSISYQPNFNMGYYLLMYTDDFKAAARRFSKAIDASPKSAEAYYNRGLAWESAGDLKKAADDFRKAMEIVPNYELAIKGLNRLDTK